MNEIVHWKQRICGTSVFRNLHEKMSQNTGKTQAQVPGRLVMYYSL